VAAAPGIQADLKTVFGNWGVLRRPAWSTGPDGRKNTLRRGTHLLNCQHRDDRGTDVRQVNSLILDVRAVAKSACGDTSAIDTVADSPGRLFAGRVVLESGDGGEVRGCLCQRDALFSLL